jgi:hypothetical protein
MDARERETAVSSLRSRAIKNKKGAAVDWTEAPFELQPEEHSQD